VKDHVHHHLLVQSRRELPERITQGVANVDGSQLRRTLEEFEHGVDICRKTNGTYIEYLHIIFLSLLAAFMLFHICACKHLENILISHQSKSL
jgi:hypothetical protein